MKPEERELVRWLRACRRGDDRAARLLHAHTAPWLTRFAGSILRDSALAEDAVQSAFCAVMSRPMREVRRVESVRAWLATIVRREALMILRKRRRDAARTLRAPGAARERAGSDAEIQAAVDRLPRRLREVVVLRYTSEMTFDQIALALGANRNTVVWRHGRAIELLQQTMSRTREVTHA